MIATLGPARADNTTLLVFAPSCSTHVIARHISASRDAGNAIQIALFEPAEPLLHLLLTIFAELMADRFVVLSDGSGWKPGAVEGSLVVVTETDAFRNDAPWIHYRALESDSSHAGLVEFYSAELSLPGAPLRDSR